MSTTTRTTPAAVAYALRWPALFVILAAEVMDLLDALITSIAGPTIVRDLGGGETLIQWLAAGYTIAMASRPADRRTARRHLRPAPDVHGRHGRLHPDVAGLRAGAVAGDADRLPRAPGPGRRRDAAAGPRHDQGDVPARRDRGSVRRLRPDHGPLRRGRADPGRLAGRRGPLRLGLADDLRDQHPDRGDRAPGRRPGAAAVPPEPVRAHRPHECRDRAPARWCC